MLASLVFAIALQKDLPFSGDRALDPKTRDAEMQSLARAILPTYRDENQAALLDNRFRLEAVAGDYAAATRDLDALRELPERKASPFTAAVDVQYGVVFAHHSGGTLEQGYRDIVGKLDDRTSAIVARAISRSNPDQLRQNLESLLQPLKGKSSVAYGQGLQLIRNYFAADAFRELADVSEKVIAEDDARRYEIRQNVLLAQDNGVTLAATIVRPKTTKKLPTILEFTIYNDPANILAQARIAAAFGYVGVYGLTRGKGADLYKTIPYLHDGEDAAAFIDRLARQSWSDGRVGTFGGSYDGSTQWAAAKRRPKALKAMMMGAPVCPGIDVPMEGNVFWNFPYPWTFYTTNDKALDNATYGDRHRWNKLDREYYLGGRPYVDLDKIDGTPNPIWNEWVSHPTYDAYWQKLAPYKEEFSKIDIPVLTTAGYFYGGQGSAPYYFAEHTKWNPRAERYLVVGPWDHGTAQFGTYTLNGRPITNFGGYTIDPVAQMRLEELEFQWFDYVFKGGAKPALLKDRVNYEVTGANVWKHAPSIAGMASKSVRLFLDASGNLVPQVPSARGDRTLKVDFADRKDVDANTGGLILDSALYGPNALVYQGEPLVAATEVSGQLSGRLSFVCNKRDFDLQMRLFEARADGSYFQIGEYWCRASSVGDLSERRLLTPGKLTRLSFRGMRLMSHRCEAGSRLVLVVGVVKEVGREINYGSGKVVSLESVRDAGEPLEIRWLGDSYLDVPVG